MKILKENLLVQFSVICFVTMAIIAVGLTVVLSGSIRSAAVDSLAKEAIATASGRLLQVLTPADLKVPMTGQEYNLFHAFVQYSIVSERTARIKIWAKDGTIIYSDNPAIIGEKFPYEDNFLKALGQETTVEINIPDRPGHEYEKFLGTLMEVYTPIIFPDDSEPQGVLEISQYYQPTALLIAEQRSAVLASMGIGFVILYGALVSIVWRGWNTINQQQRERRQAQETLEQTVVALERSNTELEQFAYIASHDLQEPLRMVSSYVQLLARRYKGQLDKDADEFIAFVVDGAARMQKMINELLTYSRVGSRGKELQPVNCQNVLNQVLKSLQIAIDENHCTVTTDPLPTVLADETQLAHLFQNLITNAIRYRSDEAPIIHISAMEEEDDNRWLFSFRDNGRGIEPQNIDNIFLMFHRMHNNKELGTGVGLAICRKIVERHGGNIWVESEIGEGSTFYFTIPMEERSQQ